ncbi:MAG: cytochrome P450 [bacterium]|nr:cytochrome P450 [bacterium]
MRTMSRLPGHLVWKIVRANSRERLRLWMQVAPEYGDLIHAKIGSTQFYLLNHPDLVQAALVTNAEQVRPIKLGERVRPPNIEQVTADKLDHRRWRKLIQPYFQPRQLAQYIPTMVSYTEAMLDSWKPGEVRDLGADMAVLTLRIVARALFDSDVSDTQDAFSRAVTLGSEFLARGNLIPLPTPRNLRLLNAWMTMDKTIKTIITARRADSEPKPDVLSTLLRAVDTEEGYRLSDEQAHGLILALFIAGHETTAIALTWAFILLAQNPDVQERLHEELNRELGERTPTADDMEALPYADWIIREAMRLYPPAWVLSRQTVHPFALDDAPIPANALLLLSPYVIQRDARFFADPLAFLPERWAEPDRVPRYAYFPFGGGAHVCIGQFFALAEAQFVLATIAQRFRLELVTPAPIDVHPLITLRPQGTVNVRIVAR